MPSNTSSNIINKNHHQKGLVNLMVVFAVGLLSLGAVLITATSAATEAQKAQNNTHSDQAFYTAESNMQEATLQYLNDNTYEGSIIPDLNTTTNVDIDVDDEDSHWPLVFIRGLADKTITNRKVLHVIDLFPAGSTFNYPAYSGADISLTSGSVTINDGGGIFANGDIDKHQNSVIDGGAYAGGTINTTENIGGTTATGVEPIPFPNIDYSSPTSPYQLNGLHFPNANAARTYLLGNPINAIVVVDDNSDLNLSGINTNLTGSLVVNGDLTISGGTYTASPNTYAALVVGGNLTISGGTQVNGLIYVKGSCDISTTGLGSIYGTILCQNGITLGGNTTINFDPDLLDNWKDLAGLDKTENPVVSQWNEE
ncbi:MAG: hypothetical protein UT82_C0012G0006 [Parcubacteria group bacterium GW2011_GWB1_40_14]|nr:MAG: hypothetical protein UT82_C0012G0006 [Parcubacteria group bacterium GW2011_GWB1_40_14]